MKNALLILCSLVLVSLPPRLSPATPLQANATSTEIAEVLQFERAWCNAYLHGNVDFLRAHVAQDFTLTGSTGQIDTLAGDIADLQSGKVKYSVFENREMKPRIYGDTAVVTGWQSQDMSPNPPYRLNRIEKPIAAPTFSPVAIAG